MSCLNPFKCLINVHTQYILLCFRNMLKLFNKIAKYHITTERTSHIVYTRARAYLSQLSLYARLEITIGALQ